MSSEQPPEDNGPWEQNFPPETEPQPNIITPRQLLTSYRDYADAFNKRYAENKSKNYSGNIPSDNQEPDLKDYMRNSIPGEDRGDLDGKIYLRLTQADIIKTDGNPNSILVREELGYPIQQLLEITHEQRLSIPHEYIAGREKAYVSLGTLNDDGQTNETLKAWIAETSTHSWTDSPFTFAVGSKIAKAIEENNQLILINIGKPLENLDDIFGSMGDPNDL